MNKMYFKISVGSFFVLLAATVTALIVPNIRGSVGRGSGSHYDTTAQLNRIKESISSDLGTNTLESSNPRELNAKYFSSSRPRGAPVDIWGNEFRDIYFFENGKLRLRVRSAGADGTFETDDDIER